MPGAGDRLHRRNWYHSDFHRTTWTYSFQLMQQKARGGPKGLPLGLVPAIKGRRDHANVGLSVRIRLTRRHTTPPRTVNGTVNSFGTSLPTR
jgi:hypothetical protein